MTSQAVSVILEVASFILIAPEFITDATLTAIQRGIDRIAETRFLYAFRFESAFSHLITATVFAGAAIYLAYLLLPLPEYARANLGVFFYALWFVDGFIAVTAMFLGFGGALMLATEAPAKRVMFAVGAGLFFSAKTIALVLSLVPEQIGGAS